MALTSFFILFSFFCGFLLDYPWFFLPYFHLSTIFLISYHASLYHPDSVKLMHLIFLGILIDIVCGRPLGVTAIGLCVVGWLSFFYRTTILNAGFWSIWTGSFLSCVVGNLFYVMVDFFFIGNLPPLSPLVLSCVCSGLLYPYLSSLYSSLGQRIGR